MLNISICIALLLCGVDLHKNQYQCVPKDMCVSAQAYDVYQQLSSRVAINMSSRDTRDNSKALTVRPSMNVAISTRTKQKTCKKR